MKQLLFALFLTSICHAQTPPTAQFSASPLSVCAGSPVNFTNQSVNGSSNIIQWAWDFGDGNSSTQTNTSHIYSAAGTYTVTLVVTGANGLADAEVKVNYITVNPRPNAAFNPLMASCTLPASVTFQNQSSGGSTYAWNFGNGQTSTLQNPPAVNYTTAGTYNVSLIVTNGFGCKDTAAQTINISNFQAGITAPATGCINTPITISDNSTQGANHWNWTFQGASPGTSTAENNTVSWSTAGTYTISLQSQNTASGCTASTTQQITIGNPPVPSFSVSPPIGCAPQSVTFTNTSPPGTNFVWTFGDGTTFNGQNPPPHTYTSNGFYDVTLSMTGSNGCPASIYMDSVLWLLPPVPLFIASDTGGCAPLEVGFTSVSLSPNPIVSWLWTFGDGTTFNGQNPPLHTYGLGEYDVSLTITTQNGCVETLLVPEFISVGQIDFVDFTFASTPECARTSVNFTNLSQISVPHTPDQVTYHWDFGDGETSTSEHAAHQYTADTGFFDVRLIVNFNGCLDTAIIYDSVYIKAPISKFQPTQTVYCNPASFPLNVAVNDQLSIIGQLSDDADMIWKWGDGTETNFDDPDFDDPDKGSTSHNYMGLGSYNITQVIHNYTTGCTDSTTVNVTISQTVASFTLSNDSVCKGSPITVQSTSTSTSPLNWYSWNMGNGNAVLDVVPYYTYTYPSAGSYGIKLTVTNQIGCSDTTTFYPFVALEWPQADILAIDDAGCAPFPVTFVNNSSPGFNGAPLESFVFTFPPPAPPQTTNNVASPVNHTFLTEGTFEVRLVATDEFGCVSLPDTIDISITKPAASIAVDSIVCNEELFTATNASTGLAPLSYEWFIDGVSEASTQTLSTGFVEPNTGNSSTDHLLTMIVSDGNGCMDTMSKTVTVSTPVPVISYTLDGAATNANGEFTCPPVFAVFTDNSFSIGDITSYSWNFGDGKSSTLSDPANTYVFPGTYSATLILTDEYGCTTDTALIDFLTIFGPTAAPVWTQDPTQCGQDVNFNIGITDNVSGIVWNLGDGTTIEDSAQFTHIYEDDNSYNPSVSVFDTNNCQVIYPLPQIDIPDIGLHAFFVPTPATEILLGTTVSFDDLSTFNDPIVGWTWDLGNQPPFTNLTDVTVAGTYTLAGPQIITLTVEDALGCFDQYQLTILIEANFEMPNIITVNGDGMNDVFSFGKDIFQSFDIVIVNRWGNIVHEKTNETGTTFWDGKNERGEVCSNGVYFYKLSAILKDGGSISKSGFLELIGH